MLKMTPNKIVSKLNLYIIGQKKAKKAVAIALRNRWRRMKLNKILMKEITPKNIIMIGPTGVGKTEIARRLAKISDSPFIKVEATKFTEVGYVGKEVNSIIHDIAEVAFNIIKKKIISKNNDNISKKIERRIINVLIKNIISKKKIKNINLIYKILIKKLHDGKLNNKKIKINFKFKQIEFEFINNTKIEEITNQIQSILHNSYNTKNKKIKIKNAIKIIKREEILKLLKKNFNKEIINTVEQNGVVFIDEIDKICKSQNHNNYEISREGVQRDLLPLIEGCTISTKYGDINTDNILFIASGAFQSSKPYDLMPEFQGRFPIQIELNPLSIEDLKKILIEPKFSLVEQYKKLILTEGLNIEFTKYSIYNIAKIAYMFNKKMENIGARRLHTILEYLLEEISYNADKMKNMKIIIDSKYVKNKFKKQFLKEDLNKFIL
ncbi:MAG: ATP-dependent protease ATPase subunit HslU [Enterobacteriaceae bacterium PSpicST1]|nr:MAG: ATP-dependent protease ATPase subunit HslU [Enterobacteriaceae bacterium PSpicST1]